MKIPFPRLTPAEAAMLIEHGQTVGFSGFTAAGAAKAIPVALAARAEAAHHEGHPFQIRVLTGASTGASLDGALAQARAISFRAPYQADPGLRTQINAGETHFVDMHISALPQALRYGFLGPIHWAVAEACDIARDGSVVLTTSVGATPTFLSKAGKVLLELNRAQPPEFLGFHDIYEPLDPPHRREIPIYRTSDRIGTTRVAIDPARIAGIVETDQPDECAPFAQLNAATSRIGENVAEFLAGEIHAGRIPKPILPLQSGAGNNANSVLAALREHPGVPEFEMYTEVLQDEAVRLIESGKCRFASTCSLTLSAPMYRHVLDNLGFFRPRLLMRPQEITNHPEVIRRLGLISINSAIEVDLSGNVNSSHIMGRQILNGIGGSGDFTRNAYLSIFTCPSVAKHGKISSIVPLVSHMDHSEHSVQVVITEQGVADLRGKDPHTRARLIIERCAHPDFREPLTHYMERVKPGHEPQSLALAFAMHRQYERTGDMRGVNWDEHY